MNSDDPKDYTEHLELACNMLEGMNNYGQEIFPELKDFHFVHMHLEGPQVVVVHTLHLGPREVDTFVVVGFYIPHDGQCTVAVNHMDGLATLDNANYLFPNMGRYLRAFQRYAKSSPKT